MKYLFVLFSLTAMAGDVVYLQPSQNINAAWNLALKERPSCVFFRPGIYVLTNDLVLLPGTSNLLVSGYGAVLQLRGTNLGGQFHLLRTDWEGNSGVTYEGFTLDCAGASFSNPGKTVGICAIGANNIVRNVLVRNLVAVGEEAFGIILRSTNGLCSGNSVLGRPKVTPSSEYVNFIPVGLVSGIVIQGENTTANGNVVDLEDYSRDNALTTFGFSVYGSYCTLSGNSTRNVDAGFSSDGSGSGGNSVWHDNIIIGNHFSGNEMCVRIDNNTQSYRDWTWIGNNFRATGNLWLLLATQNAIWSSNKIEGHFFLGNQFSGSPREKNLVIYNYDKPHKFSENNFLGSPRGNFGTNEPMSVGKTLKKVWVEE